MAGLRIGVPDLVSPSYFPAIAAVELGLLADEGVEGTIELVFPVTDAATSLRDGRLDLLAGAAHAPLYAFPGWQNARLVAAISRNTYWFLVVRSDLGVARGDLKALRDLRIGAAPGVDEGLRQLLVRSGVDLAGQGLRIGPIPGVAPGTISFGVAAAEALADGRVDAFWANGMGAQVAESTGTGTVVVDARRDGGLGSRLTFPAISTTQDLIARDPAVVAAVVRALGRAQRVLADDPERATEVGRRLFPPREAGLIAELVRRDAPWYGTEISPEAVAGLNAFGRHAGLLAHDVAFDDVVVTDLVSSGTSR
ncbi:ABC transporter substrate-binding protein [Nocardia sp. NPDC049190]|uniref:ABC transporter substrate-binding protein n=1 Tax=Nocardia sp. NPDC049190 TaxID=3155650 RepID=UPI0033C5B497